jgi:uncharacterized protein YndB with AHSA1/START domain
MTEPRADIDACSIVSTRVLPATRAQVFDAFATPERLARWWGPAGFGNRIEAFDLRPGGAWRLTMVAPDGSEHPNESVFAEVVPGRRVVFDHLPPHPYRMTLDLDDDASGGTRISWRMQHPTPQDCEAVRRFVEPANEQNFDRLEAELRRGP